MNTTTGDYGRYKKKDIRIIRGFLRKRFPGGCYTAEQVVAAAESSRSPIHRYFQWDDRRAAQLYRVQQARVMINCLVVVRGGLHVGA